MKHLVTAACSAAALLCAAFVNPYAGPAQAQTASNSPFPRLDLSDMRLWNWDGKWHASEWNHGFSPIPWKADRIAQHSNGDTVFTLDAGGAPELQAMNGTPARTSGLWEVDATLPRLKDGLVVAPLWIYDTDSKHEIDFELIGRKGLEVTMHHYGAQGYKKSSARLFSGQDLSGRRMRFGIRMNQARGYVDMFVDGRRVHRFEQARLGFFVSRPMKPWISMWGANPNNSDFVSWLGRWAGLAQGERLTMTVHGYRYTSITT